MIRFTCFDCSARTASATARYDFPVPAGPIPNVMVFFSIASTYRRWPAVFGRTALPFEPRSTAVPVTFNGTGTRSFATDTRGTIFFKNAATYGAAPIGSTDTPVQ